MVIFLAFFNFWSFRVIFDKNFYLLESFGRDFVNSMVHMIVVIFSIIEPRTYQIHFVPDFDTDFMIWTSSESEEVRLDNDK